MFPRKAAKFAQSAQQTSARHSPTPQTSANPAFDLAEPMSFHALEPRVVFDGAAVAVAADAVAPSVAAEPAPVGEGADTAPSASAHEQLVAALAAAAPDAAQEAVNEIAFIDGSVADASALIAKVPAGAQVVMLDPSRDGLAQIAAYLEGRSGVSAIHIVSHGSEGELRLGNAAINSANLGTHADKLDVIKSALTAGADILIYGCDVAQGAKGQAFVADLAARTGADIAASTDDTGSVAHNGNWQLEASTGSIEARTIDAPDWDGLLAPLVISTTALPTTTGATGINGLTGIAEGGVGYSALWLNAGTIGGSSIDLKATVTSLSASTVSFFTQGDDASIILNGGAVATIKWELFASGTSQTVYAVGSPDFRISDIDGVGGVINTRETVRPQLQGLTGYALDSPTNLVATIAAGGVQVSGTQNQNGENTSLTAFNWQDVSSWRVEYTLNSASGFANAVFRHDGDGDFTFVSAQSVSLLSLDLDANNSAATGTAYQATYVENAAGIPIVDADVAISQNAVLGSSIGKANVVLSNAKAGDTLTVGTLPAGITATVDSSVSGTISVTLSGSASVASYQSALAAIRFANSSDAPNTADRLISVSVTNTTFGTTSNTALSTIRVTAVNDAPVATGETATTSEDTPLTVAASPTTGLLVNDTDVDGGELSIASFTVAGVSGTFAAGGTANIASVGNLTINANGSYAFAPAPDFNGAVPDATYTVSDGAGGTSPATLSISVTAVNDAPTVDLSASVAGTGYTTTYLPGGTPIAITATDIGATDPDNSTLASATITLTDAQAGDRLAASTMPAGITASTYDPITHTITLTGTASLASYQTALQAITFANASAASATADRHVSVTVNDGALASNTAVSTIHVIVLGTSPHLDLGAETTYQTAGSGPGAGAFLFGHQQSTAANRNQPSFAVLPANVTQVVGNEVAGAGIAIDYSQGTHATVTGIGATSLEGAVAASDYISMSFTTTSSMPESWITHVTKLNAGGPNYQFAVAISADGFQTAALLSQDNASPSSGSPNTYATNYPNFDGTDFKLVPGQTYEIRAYIYNASGGGAAQVKWDDFYVFFANDPTGNETTFTEGGAPVSITSAGAEIEDVDNTTMTAGTVELTNKQASDRLIVGGTPVGNGDSGTIGGITYTVAETAGTVTINLSGSASKAAYIAALGAIAFENTSDNPVTFDRNITAVVTDGTLSSNVATTIVHVIPVNDAPAVTGEIASTAEDTVLTVTATPTTGLLVNDTDVDGGELSIASFTVAGVSGTFAAGGTANIASVGNLTINANGSYAFAPAPDFNGAVPVATYTIVDGAGGTASADLALSVTPVADIVGDSIAAQQNSAQTFNPLTGANGAAADNFEGVPNVTAVSTPAHGSVSFAADGTMTYTPDSGYFGDDSFTYTVNSPAGVVETATVSLMVNAPPVVVAPLGDVSREDGETLNVPTSDAFNDPDGGTLTYSVASGLPAGLSIDPNTGVISGALHADASIGSAAADGIYLVTVRATDPTGASVTTNITLRIGNPLPTAQSDSVTTADNEPLAGSVFADNGHGPDADGGLDSDTLVVGGVITGAAAPTAGIGLSTPVPGDNGGTFVVEPNGSYSFSPGSSFIDLAPGETRTTTITYMVDDGNGGIATAPLTVTVTGVNDAPVVIDPATGLPAVNPMTGLPLDPSTAAIIPGIAAQDGAPIAPVSVAGFFADVDTSQGAPALTVDTSTLPPGITFNAATGTFEGTPSKNASQGSTPGQAAGTYKVPITATDATGASVTTFVTFTIGNPVPIAQNDAVTTAENAPLTGSVFADNGNGQDLGGPLGDSDAIVVGGVITGSAAPVAGVGLAIPVAGDNGGTFVVEPNGNYAFNPGTAFDDLAPGETRSTTVTYMISDGNGGTAVAALTVTVTGTNDAPVVIDPATGLPAVDPATGLPIDPATDALIPGVSAQDGAPITPINVGGFFADADTSQGVPALSVDTSKLPSGITFDPATGTFQGTPAHDASQGNTPGQPAGTYKVPLTATDPTGANVTTFVTFVIGNPAPIANADVATTAENTPLSGSIFADNGNGADVGGPLGDTDTIVVGGVITGTATPVSGVGLATPVAGDNGGTFVVQPNGTFAFSPGNAFDDLAPGETRTTTVTYMIADGNGGTAIASLSVTVNGQNDAPVVIDPATGLPPVDPVSGLPLDPATSEIIPGIAAQDGRPIVAINVGGFFADADTNQVKPVLSVDASALPPGIAFNAATGTFEGTPAYDASQSASPGQLAGTYKVPVTATDSTGASVTTFVTFTIGNPVPIAYNDVATTAENAPLTGNVLADNGYGADTDGGQDGDTVLVGGVITGSATPIAGVGLSLPVAGNHGGTFVVEPSGDYSFDPGTAFDDLAPGETRTTTVSYMIGDGNGGAAVASLTVTVSGTNDAPVVVDPATGLPAVDPSSGLALDPATAAIIPGIAAKDSLPITPVSVAGFFKDVDVRQGAPALTADTSTLPPGLTFDPATGTFSGTPAHDASQGSSPGQPAGTYKVPVTATDPAGASVTTYVTFMIANPPPVAAADRAVTDEGRPVTFPVTGNDHDPDGDSIKVVNATSPQGDVVINPDGSLTFNPRPGFAGDAVITYVIQDSDGGRGTATVSVLVRAQFTPLPAPVFVALPGLSAVLPAQPPVTGAVADMLASFDGSGTSIASSGGTVLGESDRLGRLWQPGDSLRQAGFGGFSVEKLNGASFRFDTETAAGGSFAKAGIMIDSVNRDGVLMIMLEQTSLGAREAGRVVDFRITQADGSPLPDWLERPSGDLVQGRRAANAEIVDLTVTAIFADGREITQNMRVQAVTGDIKPLPERRAEWRRPIFAEQFDAAPMLTADEGRLLAEALTP